MKIILVSLFMSLLVNATSSQWVNQTVPIGTYYSINFFDTLTGVASGQIGKVLTTSDGGVNWLSRSTGTGKILYSSQFVSDQIGYCAGGIVITFQDAGIILKTTNAGLNWQSLTPGYSLYALYFTNINTGYVCGWKGTILKTTNGGINWNNLNSGTYKHLYSIKFIDENTGYSVGEDTSNIGNGVILKTTNAGNTWNILDVSSGLFSVFFTNSNTGWAVGHTSGSNGTIIKTTNGGINWSTPIAVGSYLFHAVYFSDLSTGWITDDATRIYKSTDSGTSWSLQSNLPSTGLGMYFWNNNTGWISGGNGIYKTTNGGGPIGIQIISSEIPTKYSLSQNYPNPFNPVTNISFDLLHTGNVSLAIYDILGREQNILLNKELKAGSYKYEWDASQYPSGIYFYRLRTKDFTETKRMILIK